MFETAPVPFKMEENALGGLAEVTGLLSLEGDYLIFEYRYLFLGFIKRPVQEFELAIADIRSMEFDSKVFGAYNRLIVRTRRQSALQQLPGSDQGRVKLVIKRVDREIADELCDEVEIRL